MGYRKQEKHYKLVFEDDEYEGLEVTAKSLSVGDFMRMTNLAGKNNNPDPQDIEAMFSTLAKSLVSWNLEDEQGNPVPADINGVKSQDFDFIMTVIGAWMEGIASVDPKAKKRSAPGSELASLPMEAL